MRAAWWDEAQALHAAGLSRREIAARVGRTENMVGKVLRGYRPGDSTARTHPLVRRSEAPAVAMGIVAEIRRLHGKRVPVTQIAAQLRVPYAEVERVIGA